jgi:hypothetical protein
MQRFTLPTRRRLRGVQLPGYWQQQLYYRERFQEGQEGWYFTIISPS